MNRCLPSAAGSMTAIVSYPSGSGSRFPVFKSQRWITLFDPIEYRVDSSGLTAIVVSVQSECRSRPAIRLLSFKSQRSKWPTSLPK